MFTLLKRFGIDGFIIAIIFAVIFAHIEPSMGIKKEGVSLGDIANVGVSLIFFFYGIKLSKEKLLSGLKNIKLHALIHIVSFILFPLIALLGMQFVSASPESLRYYILLGIFFLASLPSTVSSSVVMISIAGGNVPAGIFNASISSLLGVFITPLWMSIFVNASAGGHNLSEVFLKLILQVLLPLFAGILLNKKLSKYAEKYSARLRLFDQSVIILIIYTSFCQAFYEKMFDGFSAKNLALLFMLMIAFFIIVFMLVYLAAKILRLNREDTITALFCGSKKSLMHGSAMSKVIFANPAIAGLVLLPTMVYHAMQLVIVSAIARAISQEDKLKKRGS